MNFMIPIDLKKPEKQITYKDKILLVGSCFTEHIGNSLEELKFSTLQNPNGILFDPLSVTKSITGYIHNKNYRDEDLFYLNELWQSWQHHSRFSSMDKKECLIMMNESAENASLFLKETNWIIITLGSSFSYRLTAQADGKEGESVANCHRAPAQWFTKHLLGIDETVSALDNMYHQLVRLNSSLNIIFTVSPVRHIRDGVVENNRSKARLIEAVHHMVNKFDRLHYFPAYELIIDVLRDYRFYDVDLVHPNYMATEFVLEKFASTFIDEESKELMAEIRKISIARKHRPFQPQTMAHKNFLKVHYEKAKTLQEKYPFLHLANEIEYFSQKIKTR